MAELPRHSHVHRITPENYTEICDRWVWIDFGRVSKNGRPQNERDDEHKSPSFSLGGLVTKWQHDAGESDEKGAWYVQGNEVGFEVAARMDELTWSASAAPSPALIRDTPMTVEPVTLESSVDSNISDALINPDTLDVAASESVTSDPGMASGE